MNYKRKVHALWMDLERPIDLDGASQVALQVKNLPAVQESKRRGFDPLAVKIPWRRAW